MYAELHCISNFTFLRGASHPEELVQQAHDLGYQALAISDECSFAGIVRAHSQAKQLNFQLIIGTELTLAEGAKLVLLVQNHQAYQQLAKLISHARCTSKKGEYRLALHDLRMLPTEHCLALYIVEKTVDTQLLDGIKQIFSSRLWLTVGLWKDRDHRQHLYDMHQLSHSHQVPLVASNSAIMHRRQRRYVQDTLTAIRLGRTLADSGFNLYQNGERYLRSLSQLQQLYPDHLLQESNKIARRCHFSLDQLRYEYPRELVPTGIQASDHLKNLVDAGMKKRWPQGTPQQVQKLVRHELQLIKELAYEAYFLTVYDIVQFAKKQNILCQGRGSAANSAVCYCLGITEVDPARMSTLFERFISRERNEPPDIDVDFEHERREEVIQYVYNKYGRQRAALTATVICYRLRSAIRDVGKALGFTLEQVDRLAKNTSWWDQNMNLKDLGFDPQHPMIKRLLFLLEQILSFPRHLSQHVGGFVISQHPLHEIVPIENAAMAERTVIQWDKDDLDTLGLLKVDCLALGMLTAIHKALDLLQRPSDISQIPAEDPQVYRMIQKADTIGVFQIESRAQMSMLPRLRPNCFYDLVIEVAIVRPGPIQGKMVHPYLQRRQGKEPVCYPSPAVEAVLKRTLGVPIFQEQVMQLAVVAAGFSAGQADALRRAMAAWRRRGGLAPFEEKLTQGMAARGYSPQFAQQIFAQIKGFADYGFPESHAASFALLVYVSAWLKCHEPAAFTCALLNSQPMGFYAPAQLIQDAQNHGVEVRAVDVLYSQWESSLEINGDHFAIRLGLQRIKGLSKHAAQKLLQHRKTYNQIDLTELARMNLNKRDREILAASGALNSLFAHRFQAYWEMKVIPKELSDLYSQFIIQASQIPLTPPTRIEEVTADYESQGFCLHTHPLSLLRRELKQKGISLAKQLKNLSHGSRVICAGLVIARQRPMTAKGVLFVTLEDESGQVNIVVWKSLLERYRRPLLTAQLLGVAGKIEREGEVIHLIAEQIWDYSALLGKLITRSRDFH